MDISYLARRARLVLGQTQSQFAEQFEVDDGTVSRWERGKLRPSRAIIAKRLPKYAPELNDIEVVWRDLKAHHLAHQTFTDAEALDCEIHAAVEALNRERNVDSLVNWRISA